MTDYEERPTWSQHFFMRAIEEARMSTCKSRKVGVVFVRNRRVLVSGFNGVPRKFPHPEVCDRIVNNVPSGEKLDMCACAHAESNAITNAASEGIALYDSTVYCTTYPCWICMGMLANVGVMQIYYIGDYGVDHKNSMSAIIARHARIIVEEITKEDMEYVQDEYNKTIATTARLNPSKIN